MAHMAQKPRGRPFPKGSGGRPKGIPNKATREIQEFARACLEDPDYIAALKARLKRGTAGAVEVLLYHYGYHKPRETVAIENRPRPVIIELLTDRSQLLATQGLETVADGDTDDDEG